MSQKGSCSHLREKIVAIYFDADPDPDTDIAWTFSVIKATNLEDCSANIGQPDCPVLAEAD